MSRRVEDMSYDELFRMLTWHVRRSDTIGDAERAQEAQDEIWRRYHKPKFMLKTTQLHQCSTADELLTKPKGLNFDVG